MSVNASKSTEMRVIGEKPHWLSEADCLIGEFGCVDGDLRSKNSGRQCINPQESTETRVAE